MDLQRQRIRLGVFVLSGAGLLAAMILMFGNSPMLFQSSHQYFIVFPDAPGVVVGTPVRRSGVRIGVVKSVDLDDQNGMVRVEIAVERKYTLRSNSEPYISQDLLSRDVSIDFVPITPPRRPRDEKPTSEVKPAAFQAPIDPQAVTAGDPIPPGTTIPGRVPPDARALLREASDVLPSAQISLNAIRRSVERFEKIAPILEDTLREYTELGRSVREVIPELRKSNDDVRGVLAGAKTLVPEIQRTVGELQLAIRNFSSVGEEANLQLKENRDRIAKAIEQSNELLKRMNRLLNDDNQNAVSETLKNVKTASGSLDNTLRSTDELARDARQMFNKLQESLSRIDQVVLNLNQAIKPFAERGDPIARNLEQASGELSKTLMELRPIFGPLGRGEGSFQRIFTDASLYNNLNESAMMLAKVFPRIDRVLRDLEVFADKIARHPEQIGVGGALHRDSGLKDPPHILPGQKPPGRP